MELAILFFFILFLFVLAEAIANSFFVLPDHYDDMNWMEI